MNSNNHPGRFYHHFISKQMPCIILPASMTSSMIVGPTSPPSAPCPSNDHILNLSASMKKHCPMPSPENPAPDSGTPEKSQDQEKKVPFLPDRDCITSPIPRGEEEIALEKDNRGKQVDLNSNNVNHKIVEASAENRKKEGNSETGSELSESDLEDGDGPLSEIDVDESSCNSQENISGFGSEEKSKQEIIEDGSLEKKSKSLAFGIDRILSFKSQDDKDQTSPTGSSSAAVPFPSPGSPRVVSSLSGKSDNCPFTEGENKDSSKQTLQLHSHRSILSQLKLCSPNHENSKRSSGTLPYFHHSSFGPYRHHHHNHQHHHHHHPHHINSIITSPTGGIQNQSSHSLTHCSECLFLRRYCGNSSSSGGASHISSNRANNIPSSSSSSASNAVTNNMQFSSPLTTPSSSISASFTWMANPSIYDNSAVISPVTGFNQHIPLQPSFGMSSTGFSTLATIHQQCNPGGGNNGRRKRSWSRAVFSNLQRKGLEKRFQLQKYITKPDRRLLADSLGLTDAQVKVWFQNRRMKWRHSALSKVSSGTGEGGNLVTTTTSATSPVSSTTSTKQDGATKDKKAR